MPQAGLSQQLRRRTTLIVAALAILLGLGMLITASTLVYHQVDSQLDDALLRQQRHAAGEDRGNRAPGITAPGMPIGTIVVLQTRRGELYGSIVVEGGYDPVPVVVASELFDVPPDSGKHSLQAPEMGRYRVEVRHSNEAIVAVALPLSDADHTLTRLTWFAALLTVLAIAAAWALSRAATERLTAPLRRLSQTAGELSELRLDVGEVRFPEPVPASGLHAGHEVTQLTTAFNLMLANVRYALEQRQASETQLRQFVADASHELRNPLAAIRGYAELAQCAEGPDRDFALSRIDAESARLTKLVGDLLLLARLDAHTPSQSGPVDMVEVVLNAVGDARAAGPQHHWRLQLPKAPVEVIAEPDQLHQAVVNVLANARTHTPPGTTVVTRIETNQTWGTISITDDGPGIPAEAVPHVFKRFTRADGSRAHRGQASTGLGLAIVAALLDSWGGHATVSSRPGRTEFVLWLPLARDARGDVA